MGDMEFKFRVYLMLVVAVPAFFYVLFLWIKETFNKWRKK